MKSQDNNVNLFSNVTFIRMCFLTWVKYSNHIKQKQAYLLDKRPIINFVHPNPSNSPDNSNDESE